jgi:hypothetical protein
MSSSIRLVKSSTQENEKRVRKTISPNGFLALEPCSNGFGALRTGHGKSPCFSRSALMTSANVDMRVLCRALVDVENILD